MQFESIELTKKAFCNAKRNANPEKPDKIDAITVQVIESSPESLVVSDGYISTTLVPYKAIKEQLSDDPPAVGTILQCDLIFHKAKLMIVVSYTVMYNKKSFPIIGNPLNMEEWSDGTDFLKGATNVLILESTGNNGARDPKPQARATGAVARNTERGQELNEDDFTPIKLLDPKLQSWVICARLQVKGSPRTFTKKNGEQGSVCNCVLKDNSGEIQMIFWREEMNKFFGTFVEGDVYMITSADIKPSNPNFNRTGHKCEITCNRTTKISPVDSAPWIEKFKVTLKSLSSIPTQTQVDNHTAVVVIGTPAETTEINRKDGTKLLKTSC